MAQPLFANQRETNLLSTVAVVEEVLGELGHDPASRVHVVPVRFDRNPPVLHAWRIEKGSALAHVMLIQQPTFTHIRVEAEVMSLDGKVDRPALFAHLLELNGKLCGAAFALAGDGVLLVSERSTLDLDRSEVREMIHLVTTYADDHDDPLVGTFGGSRGAARPT
jgi:hypothetical protein